MGCNQFSDNLLTGLFAVAVFSGGASGMVIGPF